MFGYKCLALLGLLLSLALLPAEAAKLKEIRLADHDGYTRAVIELEGTADYRILNNSRTRQFVTIEVDDIEAVPPGGARATGQDTLVADAKVEYDSGDRKLRVHLKTPGAVQNADFTLPNPNRIVVDLQESVYTPSTSIKAGTWRRKIVIDPGHGGYHKGGTGTVRGKTVYEKEVTIKVAAYLEDLLRSDPRFAVDLTRRKDLYVGLFERTEIAAKLQGDLFISLHCNAVEGKAAQARARGFEIWTWNRESNGSAAAKALAKLENDDGSISRDNSKLLTTMMVDALESQSLVSRRLATSVREVFMRDSYFRANDRGIQSNRFKVLENYDMPSILVEMGFITHPEESRLLMDAAFQKRIAGHLYGGIVRYYEQNDPTFPRAPNLSRASAKAN